MTRAPASEGAASPPALRPDLLWRRQEFAGEPYYVIKDPIGLAYFRLRPEEAELAALFDGKRSAEEIARLHNEAWPNLAMSAEEVWEFAIQLGRRGIVHLPARQAVAAAAPRPSSLFALWARFIHHLIFFKIPLVDPSSWIDRLVRPAWWLWSPVAVALTVSFWIGTGLFLLVHRQEFASAGLSFLSPQTFWLLALSLGILKTLHELGHAASCRRFGAEIHEMGVGFLCFVPVGYVDASDSWVIPNKWQRIFVAAAGVYTELCVASVAAYFWIFLPYGLAKNLAFSLMVTASATTLAFNLNPLMRFDGYYALSDWLEIPNLREKAIAFCSAKVQRLLFGYRNLRLEEAYAGVDRGAVFLLYALFAYGYMVYLIYAVGGVLFARLLRPYGLERLGLSFGIFFEGSFVLLLIGRVLFDAFSSRHQPFLVRSENVWLRLAKWALALAALLLLLGGVPFRERIRGQGVAMALHSEQIASPSGGTIEKLLVRPGQLVEPGEPLVQLRNEPLEQEWKEARADYQSSLLLLARPVERSAPREEESLGGTALEAALSRFDRLSRLREGLLLRASQRGIALFPEGVPAEGRYFHPQETILRVLDCQQMVLWIALREPEARLIAPGNPIRGIWIGSGASFRAEVHTISRARLPQAEYLPAMLALHGGPVPAASGESAEELDRVPIFIVDALLPSAKDPELLEGMRARVAIDVGASTIGAQLLRALRLFFLEHETHP